MTRVVVVEDHMLVRQSLVKTVSSQDGFSVVGEAASGDEALEVIARTSPDLVLLDIGLPGSDGLEVGSRLRKSAADVRIIYLTMHDDDSSIRKIVAIGADGYVPKTASVEELLQALRAVAGGASYLSSSVARRVMDIAAGRAAGTASRLTDRELEILGLLAKGLGTSDVAQRLFVSVKTVKNHLTNVYLKLGVRGAAQAVAAAYRQGLVAQKAS